MSREYPNPIVGELYRCVHQSYTGSSQVRSFYKANRKKDQYGEGLNYEYNYWKDNRKWTEIHYGDVFLVLGWTRFLEHEHSMKVVFLFKEQIYVDRHATPSVWSNYFKQVSSQ